MQCAVAVQTGLARCNSGLNEGERLRLRVSVYLGEVLIEDANVFGDSAIVAAWLKAQAPAGGLSTV